jgi:hypothetical protein
VLNLLARLKEQRPPAEAVYSTMELTTPSEPDVHRYDRLRASQEDDHV